MSSTVPAFEMAIAACMPTTRTRVLLHHVHAGGADACVCVWADTTQADAQAAEQEAHALVGKEQALSNALVVRPALLNTSVIGLGRVVVHCPACVFLNDKQQALVSLLLLGWSTTTHAVVIHNMDYCV